VARCAGSRYSATFQVMWAQGRHRLQRSMTSPLACGVLALWSGCADGPRTVDPAEMPASVDVAQLRGDSLSRTPCTFAREVDRGMPSGSGVVRLWLDCPRTDGVVLVGFVEVASVPIVESARTGDLPDEDAIRCVRDARETQLQSCDLRHGKIAVHARATCDPDRCNAEDEARDLMARVVELLATLAEQPCRLCPKYLPPERVAKLTSQFSGTGPKKLGTIEVKVDSRIRYVAPNGEIRMTSRRPPRVLIDDARQQGEADVAPGTYGDVEVNASGEWGLLIEPR
jgi:hypothetical protein